NWLTSANSAEWRACTADAGDMDIPPWLPTRQTVAIALPWPVTLLRGLGQFLLIILVAFLTYGACCFAAARLFQTDGVQSVGLPRVVYLALVLPTLAVAAAVLATYDPQVIPQDVYRVRWLLLAVLAVPAQWGLLALACRHGWSPSWLRTGWPRERVLAA